MMASGTPAQTGITPSDFLKGIKGKHVVVKLNSGVDYRGQPTGAPKNFTNNPLGVLSCLDGYMNIAMGGTEVSKAK